MFLSFRLFNGNSIEEVLHFDMSLSALDLGVLREQLPETNNRFLLLHLKLILNTRQPSLLQCKDSLHTVK